MTNPPLDAIREEIVTSLNTTIGRELNLLDAGPEHCGHIVLSFPVIDNDELAKILHIDADGDTPYTSAKGLDALPHRGWCRWPRTAPRRDLSEIDSLWWTAESNSSCCPTVTVTPNSAPIPSLLATAAAHHHLVRNSGARR